MDWTSFLTFAAFVAVNFAAASTGAMFRPGEWYAALRKPSWVPADWVFPAVWSVLYCAIAVSGWLVWQAQGGAAWPALALYLVSLGLNAGWSVIFFGLRRMDWALAEVALLWLSIGGMIAVFAPISTAAALLLVPYLIWVTIAALLNFRVLQLNADRQPAT